MKITSTEFIISAVEADQYPDDNLPQIVFSGRSNVGKSSFINSLLEKKNIARVSQTPGKTRLINFFLINESFYFVDIPGYGYAKVSHAEMIKFATMIDEYLQSKKAGLAVLLLDIRRKPNEDDLLMYDYFKSFGYEILLVLTKADKLSNNQIFKQKKVIQEAIHPREEDTMIEYSIKTKMNHDNIWSIIENHVNEG
ncbi:MAG: ribosome biogenesis GTP-binding protein YihA/YsxC [Tenericutes bacterium]|jgi:GTP-binding protein|nr:ribosome biogenesis GTP-binding protein YihA/YsxC [Mycoplasmatota bacterium]